MTKKRLILPAFTASTIVARLLEDDRVVESDRARAG